MRDRFPWIAVGILLASYVVWNYLASSAKRSEHAETLSTYRALPDGARGIFLLAQSNHLPVRRSQIPFKQMSEKDALIILGANLQKPQDEPAWRTSESEVDTLLRLIQNGMTVVFVIHGSATKDSHPQNAGLESLPNEATEEFLNAFDIQLFKVEEDELPSEILFPAFPSPYLMGVNKLKATPTYFIQFNPTKALPLLSVNTPQGTEHAAIIAPRGKGKLIFIAAPALAANQNLLSEDNAGFWLRMVQTLAKESRTILFDEFHHGFEEKITIAKLGTGHNLQYVILQLILAAMLWFFSLKYFGRPKASAGVAQYESTIYFQGQSHVLQAGKHYSHAANAIVQRLSEELSQHFSIQLQTQTSALVECLNALHEKKAAQALAALSQAATEVQSNKSLVALARQATAIRQHFFAKKDKENESG
ncbi:MAG: DUF4350 domain-containing protein [Cystobacterineae bacterium]|nr:DUF4350 domain-containing protein [Cystobacterineae bacterium]